MRLPVGTTVSEAEKALIQLTLQHTKNNKTRAAEILGHQPEDSVQQAERVRGRSGGRSRITIDVAPYPAADFDRGVGRRCGGAVSLLYLYDFTRLAFEGAHSRALLVGDEVRDYVSERVNEDIGTRNLHPANLEEFRSAAEDIIEPTPASPTSFAPAAQATARY